MQIINLKVEYIYTSFFSNYVFLTFRLLTSSQGSSSCCYSDGRLEVVCDEGTLCYQGCPLWQERTLRGGAAWEKRLRKICLWVSFQNPGLHIFLPSSWSQNDLCWTVGPHRGIDRRLPAGQTGLEVLVWIQTVCFVRFLARGLKELWEMGR